MSELITYEREQKMEDGVQVGISKKKKKEEKRANVSISFLRCRKENTGHVSLKAEIMSEA